MKRDTTIRTPPELLGAGNLLTANYLLGLQWCLEWLVRSILTWRSTPIGLKRRGLRLAREAEAMKAAAKRPELRALIAQALDQRPRCSKQVSNIDRASPWKRANEKASTILIDTSSHPVACKLGRSLTSFSSSGRLERTQSPGKWTLSLSARPRKPTSKS